MDVATQIVEWYKPDELVILGDFLDCTPVSHWLHDKRGQLEGLRLAEDFKKANLLLTQLLTHTKRGFHFIEGNHEDWIKQAINRQPEYDGLINLELGLEFKRRAILSHHAYGGSFNIGKLWFTHGSYTNQYHAAKHVSAFERSIIYGHTHDLQTYVKVSPLDVTDRHIAISLGCLADKNPDYLRLRPNNWVHCVGVGLVRENGTFNVDPIIINNGIASYAGKTFRSSWSRRLRKS